MVVAGFSLPMARGATSARDPAEPPLPEQFLGESHAVANRDAVRAIQRAGSAVAVPDGARRAGQFQVFLAGHGDRLPACEHLAAWTKRNAKDGAQLGDALGQYGIVGEPATSNRVAQWAYGQTEAACGLTWLRADELVPLAAGWREPIRP